MIKLLTINTWKCDGDYPLRLTALRNQLSIIDADIVALQESFQTVDKNMDTAKFIGSQLGYKIISSQSRRKIRTVDGIDKDSYSNVAILSKFPITKSQIITLPTNSDDGGREAIAAEIKIGKRLVNIVSLHLTHLKNAKSLRILQLQNILNHQFLYESLNPTFLCGDFNSIINDVSLSSFLKPPFSLIDTFNYRKNRDGIDFTLQTSNMRVKIDHILIDTGSSKSLRVLDSYIVLHDIDPETGVKPSDHNGVLTLFDFDNAKN